MNEIIVNDDRQFMSVVGPRGSEKTRIVFSMLASTSIDRPVEKTCFYDKDYEPLFKQMAEKLDFEFVPCLDFETIKKLRNGLLVFADSCKELCL